MKKHVSRRQTYLFFLLSGVLLIGCKKNYEIEYQISNHSTQNIHITYQTTNQSIDSNFLSAGFNLIFFEESGSDESAIEYMNSLQSLPVMMLNVKNENEKRLLCSEEIVECWQKTSSEDGRESFGTMTLRINNDSFEE